MLRLPLSCPAPYPGSPTPQVSILICPWQITLSAAKGHPSPTAGRDRRARRVWRRPGHKKAREDTKNPAIRPLLAAPKPNGRRRGRQPAITSAAGHAEAEGPATAGPHSAKVHRASQHPSLNFIFQPQRALRSRREALDFSRTAENQCSNRKSHIYSNVLLNTSCLTFIT